MKPRSMNAVNGADWHNAISRRRMSNVHKAKKSLIFFVLLAALMFCRSGIVYSIDSPEDSLGGASLPEQTSQNLEPPSGASHHPPGQKAISVVGAFKHMKRSMKKSSPEGAGEYISAPRSTQAPDAWRKVAFSSGSVIPPSGVDPRIASEVQTLKAKDREFVYGFILMDEYLSEETRQELGAMGVIILGPHSDLYKAKFPLDTNVLENIAGLPYVEWIGYSTTTQKLDIALQQSMHGEAASESPEPIPIVINLFDDDPEGIFKRRLEATGATLGEYDPELRSYHAVASQSVIAQIILLDFVLFVEPIRPSSGGHDQSMATIGADYIRPGAPGTTYDGSATTLGIMDSGFMLGSGAATMHQDLDKWGCGQNFTTDAAGVWNDEHGHGTHVLTTIVGTGTADSRYRGVAAGIGSSSSNRIRAAKILDSNNSAPDSSWMKNGMDFMDDSSCGSGTSPRPQVINLSVGGYWGSPLSGTDDMSRKLDAKVWTYDQVYVVSAGNDGPGSGTVGAPGVAKNALTVGNVLDYTYLTVGDIVSGSSRGPTADGRMKPNVVAPGQWVTSAEAGTTNQYIDKHGTSMAAPHVTGLVATLMHHYSDFRWNPALLRAQIMATSILHDDGTTPTDNDSGGRNSYGLGRVSSYIAHWAQTDSNGWSVHRASRSVTDTSWAYFDIEVPSGADRLVVVMTWDEEAASAGASEAVMYDLDLWADWNRDCTPDAHGQCGEYASQSNVDNVEYLIINNPSAGWYRVKAINWNAPSTGLPVGFSAVIIRGDPTPAMTLSAVSSTTTPVLGSTFTVTSTVSNPAYVASGVHLQNTSVSSGLTRQGMTTTREDGVAMNFGTASNVTLGNIRGSDSRSAVWTFRADSVGSKTIGFRAWSENGGTPTQSITVAVKLSPPSYVSASDGTYADHVSVSWPSVSGASYYQVYRSTSSAGTKPVISGWQANRYYSDSSVTPGVIYYYWVKAATSSSGADASDYSPYNTGYARENNSYLLWTK